jgi:hypothetical protein
MYSEICTCVSLILFTDVRVSGSDVPAPCVSFAHFNFDEVLMKEIRKAGYERPSPIQCQAIPVALAVPPLSFFLSRTHAVDWILTHRVTTKSSSATCPFILLSVRRCVCLCMYVQ